MVSLIAQKTFTYGGLRLRPGVEFTASSRDARLLKAVGSAKDIASEAESTSQDKPKTAKQRKAAGAK